MEKFYPYSWTDGIKPIFIIGAPRSGTTWLQSMLATHPSIYSGIETFFFYAVSSFVRELQTKRDLELGITAYINEDEGREIIRTLFWGIISRLPEPTTKPIYFLEKTPSHCFLAREILFVFPDAKFIHLVRDARMVINSIFFVANSWGKKWATNDLDKEILRWKNSVIAGREIKNYVNLPSQYIEIKYEDLRTDTSSKLREIYDWLEISISENALTNIVTSNSIETMKESEILFSSISTPKKENGNNKIYPKSFIHSGNYGVENIGLTTFDKNQIDYLVGDLLTTLGYYDVKKDFSLSEKVRFSKAFRKLTKKIKWFV